MSNKPAKSFLRDIGSFLHLPAALSIPVFIVIFYYGEWFALMPFVVMICVSLILGQSLYHLFKGGKNSWPASSIYLVAIIWFLIPLLGTIPYYGVALTINNPADETAKFLDFHSAFFESMSGFTGTGLSMINDASKLPYSILIWRSMSEWLGGIGIIFLAVALLDVNHQEDSLYKAETMSWMIKEGESRNTIKIIWWIYILYSVCAIVAFYIAGMSAWEALNHGLTGISTGGFAVTKDSFVSYSSTIKWTAVVVMLMGAFSFKIHYLLLFKRNFKEVLAQTQLKYFVVLFVFFIVCTGIVNYSVATVDNVFQVASALGTCGFNSVELSGWYMPVVFLLTIAMLLGGNGSSTTGGIKTSRLVWIFKMLFWKIKHRIYPDDKKELIQVYYNKKLIEKEKVKEHFANAFMILALWCLALSAGTLIIALFSDDGITLNSILFDVASALNNVGLSTGTVSYSNQPLTKWVFIMMMWVGRLEIFAVLVLFTAPIIRFSTVEIK